MSISRSLSAILLRAAALFLIAAAMLFPLAVDASAHAVLISSSPVQGARLDVPPAEFTLTFSEAVSHVSATLVDREGNAKALRPFVLGCDVRMDAAAVADGVYALNWHVVSEDGHPISASVVFSVGAANAGTPLPNSSIGGNPAHSILIWSAKIAFYLSCLFGIGGVFFTSHVERRQPHKSYSAVLGFGAASAVLSVGLMGCELTQSSPFGIFGREAWIAASDSSLARAAGAAILALMLAACSIVSPTLRRGLSLSALLLIGTAFALTGHASGAGIKWLSFSAVAMHVIAAAFWAGALPHLRDMLGRGRMGDPQVLARFSSAIPVSIIGLIVAGIYLAWLQLGSIEALWETAYGNVLSAKLALVGTALAIGAWNRLFLTKPVLNGDVGAAVSMKRLVTVEVVLVIVALGMTAMWRFTPPPRALALQVPVSSSVHIHDAQAMATVSFEATADLRFSTEVFLQTAAFGELDPKEVKFRMEAADGSVSPFSIPLRQISSGLWRAEGVQAPCDCDWKIRIEALVSDFDLVKLEGEAKLLAADADQARTSP